VVGEKEKQKLMPLLSWIVMTLISDEVIEVELVQDNASDYGYIEHVKSFDFEPKILSLHILAVTKDCTVPILFT